MTCACICSIALCRYYLGEKDYLNDEKLKAGLDWLAKHFAVDRNPQHDSNPLYYLYSLERVGVFCNTETIGEHPWYPLGAKHLVSTQKPDGSWETNDGDHVTCTSLALLFLTRATAPVRREIKRGGPGLLQTHAVNECQNFMIILDASGSMREEMDGKEKFDVAKEVVEAMIKKLPEGAQVGLRVYGHRYTALDAKADSDSELVVPIGPLNSESFLAKLRALRCRGKTPITYSLHETAKDLSRVNSEVVTILLTDGEESTRGANPVEAAAKLASSHKGMKLHVVGFDISDDEVKEKLEKIAAAGGGEYYHARKGADLMNAMTLVTIGQADYAVLDKDGKELLKGLLGDRHELPEGKYRFVQGNDEQTFWINTSVTTHISVRVGKVLKK
jgi:Mg-chelatase subunit ChlD